MRKLKTFMVLLFAASFLWVSAPSAHALSLAPGFEKPVIVTVYPGGTTHLLCTASSTKVKAVVEQITSVGNVTGPYYFNIPNRGQMYMGTLGGTNQTKEVYFSYWDGSAGNAMLYLQTTDTTVPVQVRVTFYDLNN